jgi:hypothetical protein
VEIRTQIAALCSMIAIAGVAGAYVYQDAVVPVSEAFRVSAAAGLFGAMSGWFLAGVLRWAPVGIAQPTSISKLRRPATAARQP